jgi:tetratricopeptide (TPR) repeat protein
MMKKTFWAIIGVVILFFASCATTGNSRMSRPGTAGFFLDRGILFAGRGDAYYEKEGYDQAIADYTQAIRLDHNEIWAYSGRGSVYHDKEDYDRAIADYTQAIRLDPNYAWTYNNRGNAYYVKEDFNRAIADYTRQSG